MIASKPRALILPRANMYLHKPRYSRIKVRALGNAANESVLAQQKRISIETCSLYMYAYTAGICLYIYIYIAIHISISFCRTQPAQYSTYFRLESHQLARPPLRVPNRLTSPAQASIGKRRSCTESAVQRPMMFVQRPIPKVHPAVIKTWEQPWQR